MKRRIKFILIILTAVWMILLSRLYYLSIKSNKYYQELADRNMINIEYLTPPRGEILDINGSVIAMSNLGFSISIDAHLKKDELLEKLSFITEQFSELNETKLLKKYKKKDSSYNHKPIKIVNYVTYGDMIEKFAIFSMQKSIKIEPVSKRFYPYGEVASHVIGYVSKANQKEIDANLVAKILGVVGKLGIEKQYDIALGGDMGKREVKVNAQNRELEILSEKKPISQDIQLTIDMRVQKYISELFEDKTGALIVMDVRDGSILAAGSFPEYDINKFVQGISKREWELMITDLDHQFTNKFIAGLYPPGSATKIAVALSFLNSKLLNEKERFLCTGELRLGERKFRCWNSYGHGEVDLRRAISESCDDYFYKVGLRVGIDKLSTDLDRYGFGKKTDVDLPNEFIGTLPSRNWKLNKFTETWYKGDTLNTVIGQGNFLATPMQVALFTAMVSTGKKVTPHFVKKIGEKSIKYNSNTVFTPFELSKLKLIQEGMYDVCNAPKGTATKYNTSLITIAGKTGTSQVVGIPQEEKIRMSESDLEYYKRSHAWFTAYGPYKNPRYVVTALVEHGGYGGRSAGELVSEVFNKLVYLGYIED